MQSGDKFGIIMVNSIRTNQLIRQLMSFGKQSLVVNAGYLMGIYVVNSIVGFLFWGVAAHLYRSEDVGFTSAVIAAAFLVCGFTDFGMSVGIIRFLPETSTPTKFLNSIFTFDVLTSILAGVAYLAGIALWTPSLIPLQKSWYYIAAFLIYVTFYTLGSIICRAFVARRKSQYALFFIFISNGSRLIFVVLLFSFGFAGLYASLSLSFLLAALICLLYFLPKVEPGYRFQPLLHWPVMATILPYSLENFVVNLLFMVSQRLLPLFIIERLGPASSGHFYIAWMISDFLSSASSSVSDATFAEGSNSPERLKTHLVRSIAIGLGVTVPAAIIVSLGAPYILLIFGASYAQEASGLLRWLAIAAPLNVVNNLYFTKLRVKKQIIQLIWMSATFAIVALGISYSLLTRFGITSVGVGWLIGTSLTFCIATIGLGWYKNTISFFQTRFFGRSTSLFVKSK